MFGRRNPDPPSPEPTTTNLNLDMLGELPDILADDPPATPQTPEAPAPATPLILAAPAPAAPPAAPEPHDDPPASPAWHAGTLSILGPAVTHILHAQPAPADPAPAPDLVPRTDLESTQYARAFVPPPPPVIAAPATALATPALAQPTAAPAPEAAAARPRGIAESVIGPDDFFDGRYRSERGVRIQGNARGSIESRQYIFVEAGADVEADLSAEDITISGEFKGKITCRRRLELTSTGKIQGQVQTALLVVQEGGALDGELHMRAEQGEGVGE